MITSRALQSGLIAPAPPGPPPTSGTRDALGEGVMQNGCNSFSGIKALKDRNEARDLKVGNSLREAGACLKASENDLLIVQKRVVNPTSPGNRRPQFPGKECQPDPGVRQRRRRADVGEHRCRYLPVRAPALALREVRLRGRQSPGMQESSNESDSGCWVGAADRGESRHGAQIRQQGAKRRPSLRSRLSGLAGRRCFVAASIGRPRARGSAQGAAARPICPVAMTLACHHTSVY